MRVTFTVRAGKNVLVPSTAGPTLTRVREFDAVWGLAGPPAMGDVYVVRRDALTGDWTLAGGRAPLSLADAIATALFGETALATASVPSNPLAERQVVVTLDHGSDGMAPGGAQYDGDPISFSDYQNDPTALPSNGLLAFESIDDISIVVAPGGSTGWVGAGGDVTRAAQTGQAINSSVIMHCEKMRYRVAALDSPSQLLPADAVSYRSKRSSTHAALYYPWITVSHPIDGSRLDVPPAPYMAGIWARTDSLRGVSKSPANEVVRSALDLETSLNKSQQDLLNAQGVNCLRFFRGRGFLVWGARTISCSTSGRTAPCSAPSRNRLSSSAVTPPR